MTVPEKIAWAAANDDCRCTCCTEVRAILAADPLTPHCAEVQHGCTVFARLTYRAHCSACGWSGGWSDYRTVAEAECLSHNRRAAVRA